MISHGLLSLWSSTIREGHLRICEFRDTCEFAETLGFHRRGLERGGISEVMLPHNNDFRMDRAMCFTMQYAPDPEEITVFVLEFGAVQTHQKLWWRHAAISPTIWSVFNFWQMTQSRTDRASSSGIFLAVVDFLLGVATQRFSSLFYIFTCCSFCRFTPCECPPALRRVTEGSTGLCSCRIH